MKGVATKAGAVKSCKAKRGKSWEGSCEEQQHCPGKASLPCCPKGTTGAATATDCQQCVGKGEKCTVVAGGAGASNCADGFTCGVGGVCH